MVDILLAHSFFLANDAKQQEQMRPYPPLGTLYAASALRVRGDSVALFDATFASGAEAFAPVLAQQQPRFVVFFEDTFHFLNKMCLAHAREATCRMSAMAREAGATVLAAGSDVTDHPEVYLEHGVDYALLGEADHTLVELINALRNESQAVNEIPGLAFLRDGLQRTATRPPERQPDVFPLPAWDLVDAESYRRAWMERHGTFGVNMVTTRGCPFHCNWCAKPIWGQRYAMRSPASVAAEMALLKKELRPDHLWFADDIFGLQPQWVAEFADEIEKQDASIPFRIQSRLDLMTEKAVQGLARAGCTAVWLGVESGSQRILDAMDKGTRVDQVPVVRERLANAGIQACFFLQLGYPGETWEDVCLTVELVRQTLPDEIGVSVSYPLPGTRFYEMVRTELGTKDHWETSDDLAMMFQGTFTTPFYRRLHKLIHRDLAAHKNGKNVKSGTSDTLAREWEALAKLAAESQSPTPTHIEKNYPSPAAPDLSRPWN